MTRYRHLKIDEVDTDKLEFNLGNEVMTYRAFWPENRPMPSVGWVMDIPSDLEADLLGLLQEFDEDDQEKNDQLLIEFDALIAKITKQIRTNRLDHDRANRANSSVTNLKKALDWLRIEPYSTVDIMAHVLGKSVGRARTILNNFVQEGWLIRDEVKWVECTQKKHLFGVSSKGLYHLMNEGAVEPPPSRDFKRHKTKTSSAEHVTNIQLARLFYERIDNPNNEFRRYRQGRDLPFYQTQVVSEKANKWPTYPDIVLENSHYKSPEGNAQTIAIEIEQVHKGSKRYKELIKAHIRNINMSKNEEGMSNRYDRVIYLFADENERKNYKKLFDKQMQKLYVMDDLEDARYRFIFGLYGDLLERIEELG